MRRDVRAVRSLFASSEGPKVVARTRPQMRAKKKERRGRREEKSAPKRPGHNVLLLPAVSLWNDRIQNALSLLRRRPHESTRLVSATSSPLGQFYRYIIELHSSPDGFPPPKSRAAAPSAKEQRCHVQSSRETHTESGFKMQFQNKVVLAFVLVVPSASAFAPR